MQIEIIIKALVAAGVKCSIVGGYAVAIHGAVRGTIDLDLVIEHTEAQFIACEKALITLGFRARLPVTAKEVFAFRDEYIKKRNLIAWSFFDSQDPFKVVDIIITHDLRSMISIPIRLGGMSIPVISIEDLIAMKSMTKRPQDIEDVKSLKVIQLAKNKKK
ncbi:MAG: nucleotidyltransferase [Proteobacteria bacterium]|nr:nucleotidyltransferase [Pseudomonadota bacterium]